MTEIQGSGFKISDKRDSDDKKSTVEETSDKKNEKSGENAGTEKSLELNFSTFIISLSSSVFSHFGEIADPITGEKEVNLPLARQTIDIISMLEEKTRGNLTKDESALITNILYELRVKYMEINNTK